MVLRGQYMLGRVFAPDAAPEHFSTRGGGLLGIRPGSFIHAFRELAQAKAGIGRTCLRLGLGIF
ncbi:hypothetical protein GCM10009107_44190 [Ideonella azotifigens]|uniref:Uncharacterized protein n=2 Tax=Ideonella azotifigens TaxID=513160 RepID=A0ABP3VJ86_9BURK